MLRVVFLGALGADLDVHEIAHVREEAWERIGPFDLLIANASWLLGSSANPARTFHDLREQGLDLALVGGASLGRQAVRTLLSEPDLPLLRPFNMLPTVAGRSYYDFPFPDGERSLRIISLAMLCNRCLVVEPFVQLKKWLCSLPPEIVPVIECQGLDSVMKQALWWWLRQYGTRPAHVLGTGLGMGTIDLQIDRGSAMVSDIGVFGRPDLLAGMRPEEWWQRFMWRDHLGTPSPGQAIRRDLILLVLDSRGQASSFTRVDLDFP